MTLPLSPQPPQTAPSSEPVTSKPWWQRLTQWLGGRLYLRIWCAVVFAVAVLALLAGWAWQVTDEMRRVNETPPPVREVTIRDGQGQELGTGRVHTIRSSNPSVPNTIRLELPDGQIYTYQGPQRRDPRLASAGPRRDARTPPSPPWFQMPHTSATSSYLWMLALVAVAVALGVFPLVRWLTKRLENLQSSVAKWGAGDLSARAPIKGGDEVADLARHFNDAADHIESLLNAQKSLLANASHELRSPLARIRLAVELMGDAPTPAVRGEIKRNIVELDQLVDEILLASRLDAKEADLGTEECVDMLGLVAEEAAFTGAELQLEGSPDGCQVTGIHKLLRRMVRNLLENAKRYGTSDGEAQVEVLLKPMGSELQIRISDHGPGVPEAYRERIFEPFFRTPGASETAGGVGLGLALVKSIAERHGGHVRCEARADGQSGAAFVLTLPSTFATFFTH